MTALLPRELGAWEAALQTIAPDLVVSLGDLVRRVALLVDDVPDAGFRHPTGEPDGVSGLSRRGPLHRLAPTELALLADGAPDVHLEFLRRLSQGELAYLEIGRRAPRKGQRAIALFDVGPAQWGSPRVAHLAIFIAIAARAARAGAPLFWGPLQGTTLHAFEPASALTSLRAFVATKVARAPTDDHAAHWARELARDTDAEAWVVGDAVGSPRVPRAHAVDVSEVDGDGREPERRDDPGTPPREVLEIDVSPTRGARRRAVLPLPDVGTRARLLHDPFRRAPHASSEIASATRGFVFARDGGGVFVLDAIGNAVALPIVNTNAGTKPRHLHTPDILAVGGAFRAAVVMGRADDGPYVAWLGKRGGVASRIRVRMPYLDPACDDTPRVLYIKGKTPWVIEGLVARRVATSTDPDKTPITPGFEGARPASAICIRSQGTLAPARMRPDGLLDVTVGVDATFQATEAELCRARPGCFAFAFPRDGEWLAGVWGDSRLVPIPVPVEGVVLGATTAGPMKMPALIVQHGAFDIILIGPGPMRRVLREKTRIRLAAYSDVDHHIVYETFAGEIVDYNLHLDREVVRARVPPRSERRSRS